MSQLHVYKASAGSGKTFRLAVEYLKIALSSDWNYKHILAVTFTNKATTEMKYRVVHELYQLAHSGLSVLMWILFLIFPTDTRRGGLSRLADRYFRQ